jgi:hypothetical protein
MTAPKTRIKGQANITPPWQPIDTSVEELAAIHAMADGAANDRQQMLIIEWLMRATAVTEMEFRPTGERESNFAAGKRFVGLQFFTLARSRIPAEK